MTYDKDNEGSELKKASSSRSFIVALKSLEKMLLKKSFCFVAGYYDLAVAVARPPVSSRPPIISINLCWSVSENVEFFLVVVLIGVV